VSAMVRAAKPATVFLILMSSPLVL